MGIEIARETVRREVLEAVRRLRAKRETVKLDDVFTELKASGLIPTEREVSDALKFHRRAGALRWVTKTNTLTGERRKTWGWLLGKAKRGRS